MLFYRLGLRLPACRSPPLLFRLPPSARPRHASTWARHSFFTRTPPIRFFISRRHALWLVPVAGGLTLYLLPRPKSIFPAIFSSPTLIPCPPTQPQTSVSPIIFSPLESDKTMISRVTQLLREHIWEPILTAKRFIYLFVLFVPVIITSPMLLVGKIEKRLKGDSWGAVWWYGLLVRQMKAAGPTFIKVSPVNFPHVCACQQSTSWRSGPHPEEISSLRCYARSSALCILMANPTPSNTRNKSSSASSNGHSTKCSKCSTRSPSAQERLRRYTVQH